MIELSLLCLQRLNMEEVLSQIVPYVDSLHLDIMDETFVTNTAFSPEEINRIDYDLPKHIHIMSRKPEPYIDRLQNVESVSFHYEAVSDHLKIIKFIKSRGYKAGISVNPETPVEKLVDLLPHLDRVVLMAVKPGYSGTKYLPETSRKIVRLRKLDKNIPIVIDGGMHEDTIREVMALGANACVVCSVIAKSPDYKAKTQELRLSGQIGSYNREDLLDSDRLEPFSMNLSSQSGALHPFNNHWKRRLSDLKNVYRDTEAVEDLIQKLNDPVIYEVWQHDVPFENGHLLAVTTCLYSGKVGDEYFMTKGHFHQKAEAAEIYLCISGDGILRLQTKNGQKKELPMNHGTVNYIPPHWAHRVVNVGEEKLIFYGVYPADAGHDYSTIEKKIHSYF